MINQELEERFAGFAEWLALPSLQTVLFERFQMEVVAPRVRSQKDGRFLELDALAYSESAQEAYVVEVKGHLGEDAIEQLRNALQEAPNFFPALRGMKIYGVLAAREAPKEVGEKVLREGFYFAQIHDGQFEIQVPGDFQPRAFGLEPANPEPWPEDFWKAFEGMPNDFERP